MKDLLRTTAERAARYLAGLKSRGVAPSPEALTNLKRLDELFPEHPTDPSAVMAVRDEVHVSVLRAVMLVGLGRERVIRVPVDGQGRMRADALPPLDDHTIVCLQAGNVNTGAFDPADGIIPQAKAAGAWVHVDGAFGLWAAAAPARAHLVKGFAGADSWAIDAHKWLNVPYDSA